jgi:hypothetical protein
LSPESREGVLVENVDNVNSMGSRTKRKRMCVSRC